MGCLFRSARTVAFLFCCFQISDSYSIPVRRAFFWLPSSAKRKFEMGKNNARNTESDSKQAEGLSEIENPEIDPALAHDNGK